MVDLSLWLHHNLSAQIYQDGILHKIYLRRYVKYALFTQIDACDTISLKEGDTMPISKAQQKAVNRYMKDNYDDTKPLAYELITKFGSLHAVLQATPQELMTVSGIGANTARMIMSAYSAAEIRQIIATGNARALSQVKGLGPKTAQRIIVDLKDKVLKVDLGNEAQGERLEAMGLLGDQASIIDSGVKQEAVSALVMLGFAAAASGKVVDKILKAAPESSVEQVIKQALKML